MGPGGKTVLPGRAEAKLEFRLVPAMTKDEAVSKLKAHLAKRGFDDVQVTISGGYGPNETDEDSTLIRAQKKLFEQSGIPYSITPRNAVAVSFGWESSSDLSSDNSAVVWS